MTHVVSAKLPTTDGYVVVGQKFFMPGTDINITVTDILMAVGLDALGRNCMVSTITDRGDVVKGTLLDFEKLNLELISSPDMDTIGGLHGHHLLDQYNSITVGQRWQHHKGDIYVITSVALDANVGADDFGEARISYRDLQTGKKPEWSLTVNEFLKLTTEGKKRFTCLPMTAKEKRGLMMDKSLRYMWRIYE